MISMFTEKGHEAAFFEQLYQEVRGVCDWRRPCLLLMDSIASSDRFGAFADVKGLSYQLLNEVQSAESEFIIAQAGRSGILTIATNTAGRGTDIVLSQESLSAGGWHLIVAFYPENDRVEAQAVGRAGRQGQPGSSKIIVHAEGSTDRTYLQDLAPRRAARVKLASQQRLAQAAASLRRWDQASWYFTARSRTTEQLSTAFLDDLARWRPPSGRLATKEEKTYGRALARLLQQRQTFFSALDVAWGRAFALLAETCESQFMESRLSPLGLSGNALLAMAQEPRTALVQGLLPRRPT